MDTHAHICGFVLRRVGAHESQRDTGSPGVVITEGYEPPTWVLGTKLRSAGSLLFRPYTANSK